MLEDHVVSFWGWLRPWQGRQRVHCQGGPGVIAPKGPGCAIALSRGRTNVAGLKLTISVAEK